MIAAVAGTLAQAAPQLTPSTAQQSATAPAPAAANTPGSVSRHVIQLQFDYDFRKTRACTGKIRTKCVDRFVIYNVYLDAHNREQRIKLGVIPLPESPKGLVKGITGKTPPLSFSPGDHKIVVVAEEPNHLESSPEAASVMIKIP